MKHNYCTGLFLAVLLFIIPTATFAEDLKIRVYASNPTADAPIKFGIMGRVDLLLPPHSSKQIFQDAILNGSRLLIEMKHKDRDYGSMLSTRHIREEQCKYLNVIWRGEGNTFETMCEKSDGTSIEISERKYIK